MGLPEGTNRAFLGHFFTYKLGWLVLGLGMLGASIWWSKDNLFAKQAIIENIELGLDELRTIQNDPNFRSSGIENINAFHIILPKETVGMNIISLNNGRSSGFNTLAIPHYGQISTTGYVFANNYRHEFTQLVGSTLSAKVCNGNPNVYTVFSNQLSKNIGTFESDSGTIGAFFLGDCIHTTDPYGFNGSGEVLFHKNITINKWSIVQAIGIGPNSNMCSGREAINTDCGKRERLRNDIFNRTKTSIGYLLWQYDQLINFIQKNSLIAQK